MELRRIYRFALIGIVTVLLLKLATGYVTPKLDDRRLADQLRSLVTQATKELVFINTTAQQGLSFYLPVEVEEISLWPSDDKQSLESELREPESGRVWLAREKHAAAAERRFAELGAPVTYLGTVQGKRKYKVYRALQPADK